MPRRPAWSRPPRDGQGNTKDDEAGRACGLAESGEKPQRHDAVRRGKALAVFDSLDLVRDALMLTLLLSAPILAVGLLVGLVISIAQAVTQIQDQTISFVPKIASMLIVAVAILGWLSVKLVEFAAAMFTNL